MEQIISALPRTGETGSEIPISAPRPEETDDGEAAGFFASLLAGIQTQATTMKPESGPAPPQAMAKASEPNIAPGMTVAPGLQQASVPATSPVAEVLASAAKLDGDAVPGPVAVTPEEGAPPLPLPPETALEAEEDASPTRIPLLAAASPQAGDGSGRVKAPASKGKPLQAIVADARPRDGTAPPVAPVVSESKVTASATDAAAVLRELLSPSGSAHEDAALQPERLQVSKLDSGPLLPPGVVPKPDAPLLGSMEATRPASTAPPTSEPVPLRSVPDFSIKSIKYLMENNVESIRIRLVPRSLGELHISVVKTDDVNKVVISSANPAVRDFLDGQLPGLRENLHKEAIQVNQISVQARPISIGDHSSHGNAQQQASANGGDAQPQPERNNTTTLSGKPSISAPRHHDGILNMYV